MEEKIKEIIEEMSTEDKIALWNEYCDSEYRTVSQKGEHYGRL